MLISHKRKLLIATPTKCGTTSLEHAVKKHIKQGGDPDIIDIFRVPFEPRRQHRMSYPEVLGFNGLDRYRRLMVVRDPRKRWESVYKYLGDPAQYSQWGSKYVQGRNWPGIEKLGREGVDADPMTFVQFLRWMFWVRDEHKAPERRGSLADGFAYRAPWVWSDGLDFSAKQWKPEAVIRTEHLWDDFGALGLEIEPSGNGHANATGHRSPAVSWDGTCEGNGCVEARTAGGKCAACKLGIPAEVRYVRRLPLVTDLKFDV